MSVILPVRALPSIRWATATLTHVFLACCLMAVAVSASADEHVPVDYLGHNTAISVADGQIGITAPDSINLGDFLIAQISFTGGSSVNITDVPDDWQLLVREDHENDLGHAVFYQIVGNPGAIPAPGTAFQWVFDQDISAIGAITRYSGVDFNNPIQAVASDDGHSTAMKVPGVAVPDPGNVINLYAIGAVADLRKPGSTTLRYNVNNPDPVTVALRDYRIDDAPTESGNDVVLGFADNKAHWITHTVAVRARVGSLTDPFNSLISAAPVEITADGDSTSTITVQARDSDGNNINTGGDNVIIETDAGTLLGSVVDNGDGTYTQQLQSSTAVETATVTGTIYGFDIEGSAIVNFTAGNADAQGSSISAADSQLPADGASSTAITVQVRDEFGNPVAASGLDVELSTTLGSLGSESGVTDSDGRFQTSLTSSTSIGTAEISGTLDNVAIGNTASVEFIDSPIDSGTSTISVADSQLTANGTDTTTVTVQLLDASGVEVEIAGVNVQVFAELGSLEPASGQTDANGQFTTTLTAPTEAGTDTISGRVLGDDIGNTAQVEYVAGPATRLRFAEQPVDGMAGVPFSTAVEIVDANGNRVESANNTIDIQLTQTGDATLSGTLSVAAVDGLASFNDLSIDLADDYSLTASASGLTAAVSSSFSIAAGDTSGTNSEISADPEEIVANGVSTSTITVQAQDEFGNPASESGLSVTLSTTAGSLAETSGTTNADGQFTTALTSTTSTGSATISGTLDGETISDTATVNFVEATLDAGSSSIEAADDELEADGVSSTTITVQVRDADGQPMVESDLPVTLSTTLGTLADTNGTTDSNGQFVTTLTSETMVGTAEITGTLDGEEIGDTASVAFVLITGEDATALAFDIQPGDSVENFPIRGPVTVGFVDAGGIPVDDHDANITIQILSGPDGATLGGTTTLMSEGGFAVFSDITLDMIGDYELVATSQDVAPANSEVFRVRVDGILQDRFEE